MTDMGGGELVKAEILTVSHLGVSYQAEPDERLTFGRGVDCAIRVGAQPTGGYDLRLSRDAGYFEVIGPFWYVWAMGNDLDVRDDFGGDAPVHRGVAAEIVADVQVVAHGPHVPERPDDLEVPRIPRQPQVVPAGGLRADADRAVHPTAEGEPLVGLRLVGHSEVAHGEDLRLHQLAASHVGHRRTGRRHTRWRVRGGVG